MTAFRRPQLADLAGRTFDVLITGGGVYGACFAYELASRGLRVLLVEKEDFGAAASANSLRIVHGGLRYLQKLDLRRARASAAERSVLLRIFPGLITPLLCALPTGPGFKTGRLALAGGLAVNAVLTFDRNAGLSESQRLPAGGLATKDWLSRRSEHLALPGSSGTAFWYDAFMQDPDRLVFSYIAAAASHGATSINHASVDHYLANGDRLHGAVVTDRITDTTVEIRADLAIDCRSGWLAGDTKFGKAFREHQGIRYARGINLVVDRRMCECAVGFPSSHGREKKRFLFMVPQAGKTMIGTWYLPLRQPPCDASTRESERRAMMEEIAAAMPAAGLSTDDIVSQQVGILPCMDYPAFDRGEPQPTEGPAIVRGQALGAPKGVWFIQGEKWTTARMTAEAASTMIAEDAGKTLGVSRSSRIPLSSGGSPMPISWSTSDPAIEGLLRRLWLRRGRQALEIAGLQDAIDRRDTAAILLAEARFAAEHEMALSLGDIVRRLGLGQLERPAYSEMQVIAGAVACGLGWSESDMASEIESVLADSRYAPRNNDESPRLTHSL